jgi:polyisoprenoid-binding protein YceI
MASAFTLIHAGSWKISDDYAVKFDGKGASGTFRGLKGDIVFDEHDLPGSRFNVSIQVNTVNTGIGLKNKHAKSEKYFDAEKYPLIRFTSSSIKKTEKGYAAGGTMEIHGVKKEISLPFTYTKTSKGALFTSSFEINRLDYKIGSSHWLLGSTFTVELSVPVTK